MYWTLVFSVGKARALRLNKQAESRKTILYMGFER